jgi:hypothetical protein
VTSTPSANPSPVPVKVSGGLVGLEAIGLLALAAVTVVSGLRHDARIAQLIGQGLYFVVLALLLGVVASGLIRGKRWSRTPAIVAQLVVVAIGVWMAVPSGRIAWGIGLIAIGLIAGGLLVTPVANAWIRRFPPLFGPEPDR